MAIVDIPLNALKTDKRRPPKSDTNPYDRATIFSVFPREIIDRTKVTLQPNLFIIPPGKPDLPSRLVVEPAVWWRDIDPEQELLEIPVSAVVLAHSIVTDHNNSIMGANAGDAVPGIFYVPGDIALKELAEKYQTLWDNAILKQRRWYEMLVKLGDALWARTNGNPLAVDDLMRLACIELGLTRDWATLVQRMAMIPCSACGNLRNPAFPICSHCKNVVDKKKAEELGLLFAK